MNVLNLPGGDLAWLICRVQEVNSLFLGAGKEWVLPKGLVSGHRHSLTWKGGQDTQSCRQTQQLKTHQ